MGQNFIQIAGWIVTISGGIITLCGSLIAYIFKRHVKLNDDCEETNRDEHKTINGRIDKIYEALGLGK